MFPQKLDALAKKKSDPDLFRRAKVSPAACFFFNINARSKESRTVLRINVPQNLLGAPFPVPGSSSRSIRLAQSVMYSARGEPRDLQASPGKEPFLTVTFTCHPLLSRDPLILPALFWRDSRARGKSEFAGTHPRIPRRVAFKLSFSPGLDEIFHWGCLSPEVIIPVYHFKWMEMYKWTSFQHLERSRAPFPKMHVTLAYENPAFSFFFCGARHTIYQDYMLYY